jgi:hypothetical protein
MRQTINIKPASLAAKGRKNKPGQLKVKKDKK